jgi:hypothetical protein
MKTGPVCAGVASCTVPADAKLDLTNNEAVFAVCIRLGLPLPQAGLTSATRCLRNCALTGRLMGPRAELDEATVSESIMTGRHFLGCAACRTYCRHNGVVQAQTWRFTISSDRRCASPDAHAIWGAIMLAGRATRTGTPMDRRGEARTQGPKIAFDVGIVGTSIFFWKSVSLPTPQRRRPALARRPPQGPCVGTSKYDNSQDY